MKQEKETHIPVIKVEDYAKADGKQARRTDVTELSIGLNREKGTSQLDLSGKIWRQDPEKSEELPVTRILDLAILVAQTGVYFQDAYRHEKFYDPNDSLIEIIGVQGNRMTVEVDLDNPDLDQDILAFHDTWQKDGELYGERFRILKRLLDELGY